MYLELCKRSNSIWQNAISKRYINAIYYQLKMNFILPVVFKRLGKTQKCGCNGVPIHQNKLSKILFSKKPSESVD